MKYLDKIAEPTPVPNQEPPKKPPAPKTVSKNKNRFWKRLFQSLVLDVTEVVNRLIKFVKMGVSNDLRYSDKKAPVSIPNQKPTKKQSVPKTSSENKNRFWNSFFQSPALLVTEVVNGIFRYVKLSNRKGKYSIDSYGAIPAGALSADASDPAKTHSAGMEWIRSSQSVNSCKILIVPPKLDFFVRRLEIPRLKRDDLYSAAAWEVDKLIPIPIDESYLLLKDDRQNSGGRSIAAGVVPRYQIDIWEYLGDSLSGVVPISAALASLGPKSKSSDSAYSYIFYNGENLNIGFYNSNGLQYSHPLQLKSNLLFDTGESGITTRRVVEELVGSIEIFYSYFPDITISGVVLMVFPDKIENLIESILERMDIEILTADSAIQSKFANPDILKSLDIDFLPLLGAAVADKREFKFLPRSRVISREYGKLKKIKRYYLAISLILAVLFAGFWAQKAGDLVSELADRETVKSSILNSAVYSQLSDYKDATEYLTKLREEFDSGENKYSGILKILSMSSPEDVHLESVATSNQRNSIKIRINGYYDGDLAGADIAIMSLMESLSVHGFSNLKLQRLGNKISGNRKIESFVLDGIWAGDEYR